MIDINMDLLQCFINLLIQKSSGGTVKNETISNKKQQKNYTNKLLENLRKEIYTHLLSTIIGAQIQHIYN